MHGELGPQYRRRAAALHTVVLDGGALVWDDRTETLHCLNESAALVWTACSEWASVDALTRECAPDHGARTPRREIEECVQELARLDLLDVRVRAVEEELS